MQENMQLLEIEMKKKFQNKENNQPITKRKINKTKKVIIKQIILNVTKTPKTSKR